MTSSDNTSKGISEETVLSLADDLIAIPSENPPGNEGRIAEFLRDRLDISPVPFEITTQMVEPGRPNVIARVGDSSRGTVLLSGHVDVVPANADDWTGSPFQPRRDDGRLVGRGAADMKGALAAKIVATESYWESTDDAGEIVLAFVMGEERGGVGTRHLVDEGIDADAAIVGEPSDVDVCVAQKGVARYNVTVHGESCHTGRPDEGVNAIQGMRRVLERLDEFDDHRRRESHHDYLTPETLTVTLIEGGIAENVVPDEATIHVDWRVHPGRTDPSYYDRRIGDVLADVTLDGDPVSISVERDRFIRPAEVAADSPVVQSLVEAARSIGRAGDVTGFNAATDARFLVHDAGIPTVVCGPGSIADDAHTVGESVAIDDLVDTARIYRSALGGLLG